MKLGEKQELFARLIPSLYAKAHELGFEIRKGDAFRDPRVHGPFGVKKGYGHKNSCHKLKLAEDLNLFNIHSQCVKCNRYNSGNAVDYRIRLIEKIGVDRVERLECDNAPKSFTIDYLSRLQKIFLKRSRHLKKLRGNT